MSAYLSLGAWYILPQLVTGWVRTAYYAIWIRAGEPKPTRGSRQWVQDNRRIQTGVILLYLLYTIIEADWQIRIAGDCYRLLGVRPDVDERGLNSRFRRLTVQYHPDKVPANERAAADWFFVQLKDCRETIADPVKRFAYDRFGPEILSWQHCSTIADYVFTGVRSFGTYYAFTILVLVLMGFAGRLRQAAFWRYWAIAAMAMLELYTISRPNAPAVLTKIINPLMTLARSRGPYLQFQFLTVARKILLSFFIAVSQIGPLLLPADRRQRDGQITGQQLERLETLATTQEQEASRLMALDLTPFALDQAAMAELRTSMKRWLIDNTIRSNPAVRDATTRSLERRNAASATEPT